MKYSNLQKELLKSIRGHKPQHLLNQELGFSFNQVSRWETGRVQLSWIEFLRIADLCKLNLEPCFQKIFGSGQAPFQSDLFLRHLTAGKKIVELSSHLNISRYILSRWLSGKTIPSLTDILYVIDKMTPLLVEFVAEMISIESIPSLKEDYAIHLIEKKLNYKYPFLGAVLRCLELKDYQSLPRHVDGFISQKLLISLAQEREILADMLRVKIIKKENEKYASNSEHIDTRGDFVGLMNIKKYWLNRALDFSNQLSKAPEKSFLGYNVMSVSPKARKEIEAKYFQFFQEIRSIVEMDHEAPDEIQILNIQILTLSDFAISKS